jgi:sterol 3beta-glucosyltransferase
MGSEGDVRPFVALAAGLRRAGHDAWIVAAERFRARAGRASVPFRPTGQNWDEAAYRAAMSKVFAEKSPLTQIKSFVELGANELVQAGPGVVEATRDADLIVHHAGDVNAFAASIVHGKPRITGALAPALLPGGFAAWMARMLVPRMTDKSFHRVLDAVGVPPRKGVVLETAESPLLNLVAISPHVVAPKKAWRGRYEATGYWFLDEPHAEVDPELRAFVESGAPPVVITFGSMTELDARVRGMGAAIVEGVRASGRRAVVQAAEGLDGAAIPDSIFVTGYVPHDWLFPRSAGVVHHGGAGTSAASLRAGVPQSMVWVFGDQPEWGKLLHARGVAAAPMPLAKLTAQDLSARLRAMDEGMRARAKALGDRIAAEDGVGRACALIEERLQIATA